MDDCFSSDCCWIIIAHQFINEWIGEIWTWTCRITGQYFHSCWLSFNQTSSTLLTLHLLNRSVWLHCLYWAVFKGGVWKMEGWTNGRKITWSWEKKKKIIWGLEITPGNTIYFIRAWLTTFVLLFKTYCLQTSFLLLVLCSTWQIQTVRGDKCVFWYNLHKLILLHKDTFDILPQKTTDYISMQHTKPFL